MTLTLEDELRAQGVILYIDGTDVERFAAHIDHRFDFDYITWADSLLMCPGGITPQKLSYVQ